MLFLIIFILTIASGYFLPWWAAAIIAFLAALYWGKTSGLAFGLGFLAVFTAWIILALVKSIPNDNRLATRVSQLFHLPNWILLLIITALIGGLVGGMAALSGVLVKKALQKS
ncbi:MAG: hypothetical protein JWQ06_2218 [Mucilaginibacter sp.]|nr:hypothetical protein [Mucilaginibacter sp.]